MMKDSIKEMILQAETARDMELIDSVRKIVDTFASTINCPTNWRSLGNELAEEYPEDSWVYENLELWNYAE